MVPTLLMATLLLMQQMFHRLATVTGLIFQCLLKRHQLGFGQPLVAITI